MNWNLTVKGEKLFRAKGKTKNTTYSEKQVKHRLKYSSKIKVVKTDKEKVTLCHTNKFRHYSVGN